MKYKYPFMQVNRAGTFSWLEWAESHEYAGAMRGKFVADVRNEGLADKLCAVWNEMVARNLEGFIPVVVVELRPGHRVYCRESLTDVAEGVQKWLELHPEDRQVGFPLFTCTTISEEGFKQIPATELSAEFYEVSLKSKKG